MTARSLAALAPAAGVLLLASCSSAPTTEPYLPAPAALQSAVDCSTTTGWEEHLSGDYAPPLAVPSERGPASCLDYGEILPGTATALNALTATSTRNVPLQEPAP